MKNFFLKGLYITVAAIVVFLLASPFVLPPSKASLITPPPPQTEAEKERATFYETVNSFVVVQDKTKKPTKDDIINSASLMAFVAGISDTIGARLPPKTTLTEVTQVVAQFALADTKSDAPAQIVIESLRQKYSDLKNSPHPFLEVGGFLHFLPSYVTVASDTIKGVDSSTTSWVGAISYMGYVMGVLNANYSAFGESSKHGLGECTDAVEKYLAGASKSLDRDEFVEFEKTPTNLIVTAACF